MIIRSIYELFKVKTKTYDVMKDIINFFSCVKYEIFLPKVAQLYFAKGNTEVFILFTVFVLQWIG